MDVSVVGVDTHPQFTPRLESRFLGEWDRIDPLIDPKGWYPSPLFALDDLGDLVGGLAFTRHESLDGDEPAVWVNAVLVRPEARRRGIASTLIRHAELAAASCGAARLYAHTDLPILYTQLGWDAVPGRPDKVLKMLARGD